MDNTKQRWRQGAAILLVVLVGLGLRVAPIDHSLPGDYVRDAEFPHAALLMLQDREPVPPLHEYTHWPYLLSYMAVPLFGLEFAVGLALGSWSGPDEFGAYVVEHPEVEQLTGRLLVALLGALTIWVAYRVARRLRLQVGAWVVAWLIATSLLHLHLSVQERPWVPMIFFAALALWGAVAHQSTGRAAPLLLACAAAACAYSTRTLAEQGRVTLGIPGLAWYLSPIAWRSAVAVRRRIGLAAGGLAVFLVVALVAGRPYLLRYPDGSLLDVVWQQLVGAAGAFFFQADFLLTDRAIPIVFRAHSFVALGRTFSMSEPVLLALALPGIVLALRSRAYWPGTVFGVLWALLFLGHRNAHAADSTPLVLFLAFPAALTAEWLWRRRSLRPVLLVLLAIPLVIALRYVVVMTRADTRVLAQSRLLELPPGAVVAIDAHGPQPLLELAALERLAELRQRRGGQLGGRDASRKRDLVEGKEGVPPGIDALDLDDVLDIEYSVGPLAGLAGRTRRRDAYALSLQGEEAIYTVWAGGDVTDRPWPGPVYQPFPEMVDLGSDAGEILATLGVRYLMLLDFSPSEARPHPLEPLVEGQAPLWVVEPGAAGKDLFEARLPLELERPVISLWQIERPGPRVRLYELAR